MKTTKTISAMTFAAALCCASPVFAGGHVGAAGVMAGTAGVRSSTVDASFGESNFDGNGPVRALPRTGTHINPNGNVPRERSRTHGNMREREREKPNGVVEEQRQERRTNAAGLTQTRSQVRTTQSQAPRQGIRERSRTHGSMREREREKPNGVVEEQRQEQRTNAAGQTQTRSQVRIIQPHS